MKYSRNLTYKYKRKMILIPTMINPSLKMHIKEISRLWGQNSFWEYIGLFIKILSDGDARAGRSSDHKLFKVLQINTNALNGLVSSCQPMRILSYRMILHKWQLQGIFKDNKAECSNQMMAILPFLKKLFHTHFYCVPYCREINLS